MSEYQTQLVQIDQTLKKFDSVKKNTKENPELVKVAKDLAGQQQSLEGKAIDIKTSKTEAQQQKRTIEQLRAAKEGNLK